MNTNPNKIEILINDFFDSELNKKQESDLFNLLAQNQTAREYFTKMNRIKRAIAETSEEFPINLEEDILGNISQKLEEKNNFITRFLSNRHLIILTSGFVTIIIALIIFLFSEINYYKKIITTNQLKIKQQAQVINLITNYSLKEIEINAKKTISRKPL